MRISGDAEQCARAGVTLLRTATSISTAAQALQQTRWSHPGWLGTAAQGWSSLSGAQATNGFALADRIAAAGRALLQHAEALEELQQRARGLRTEALDAGLDLDDDGWIRPVEAFIGPASNPAQAQAALLASHRQAVRADLLRRVALVRQDQELAQQRLARVLQGIAADLGCGPGIGRGAPWAPTWWDLPPVVIGQVAYGIPSGWASPTGPVLKRALGYLGPVLRRAPGAGVLGFGYGVVVDTAVNDLPIGEAVGKNGASAAAGTAVAVAVGAGIASAPFTVPVVVAGGTVVVVGGAVSYGVGKLWDAKRGNKRPRVVSRPTPTPMRHSCR